MSDKKFPAISNQIHWLTLNEASELLGIHYSTLRSWADKGEIPVFRTPGGHRRFRLADVRAFLQDSDLRMGASSGGSNQTASGTHSQGTNAEPASVDGVMEHALGRVRQEIAKASGSWRTGLDESTRETNRERGRRLFALALNYVMQPDQREQLLADGQELGRQYGQEAARSGVSLAETGRAVQFFRRQLLESVRRDETLDPADVEIRQTIAQYLDEVLYAVLEGYEETLDQA